MGVSAVIKKKRVDMDSDWIRRQENERARERERERERDWMQGEKGERDESKDIYGFKENSKKKDTEEAGWNVNRK